ncbi:uncharacterized protein LOC130756239 isoform X2 [Actinidia eriantha]|uniref:uncharacterized protein LOC130756239 isoform X2 n=1 Tax=Actinidia eriantha TaxID=165200 RepID=UPI0025830A14|nr:uncharacterized protein LOC130756239 isoform X2 [Actinidia eriantha]
MAKGDKVLLSPGFIANCVPVYERERMENIRRNNEVCKSLGVKRITPASVGLVQHKRSTAKAKCTKRSNGELDDVDYRPQDDEDDRVDSDSSDSFEKEARSEQNQKNRTTDKAKHRCKHRCGSKSLPVRVATAESLGVVSALAKVHKSTHFNKNTNEWITPESEVIHDKIEQIEVEQNSQDGAIPITQEELSIKVFGRKSGYVTGLGMRPSSSSRNIVGHGDNIKYVTQLEQKVQEQADQIQKQADKIQEQAKGIEAANNKIHELVEAKEEQGRTLASVMDYLKCQGYTG